MIYMKTFAVEPAHPAEVAMAARAVIAERGDRLAAPAKYR
jgi:hypothetical protein